jgi:predicted metal-dependent hydrolase
LAKPPTGAEDVVIVRSRRRQRTAAIRERDWRTEVLLPAGLSPDVERDLVDRLVGRLREQRRRERGDADLEARAKRLSARYLDGRAVATSVRYVDNMASRWGSATPTTGAVRLSRALSAMPEWVLDYVLLHELCHLLVADHSRAFWRLVGRYPRAERARGYLLAVAHPPRT